jgi:hypothetical protein
MIFMSKSHGAHAFIKASCSFLVALLLLTGWRSVSVVHHVRKSPACWLLTEGEVSLTTQDTRTIISAKDSVMVNMRTERGVPYAPEDSVRLYASSSACDSAAAAYDALRASKGDTAGHFPVALFRIYGTKVYIGTALDGRHGCREYVAFDSIFTIKGTLHLCP